MRALILLSFLFLSGCAEKPSPEAWVANDVIPKFGALNPPHDAKSDRDRLTTLYELCSKQEYDRALNRATWYVEQFPQDGEGWNILGDVQSALKKVDDAKLSYVKAIGYRNMSAHYGLAVILWNQGKHATAIEAQTQLVELHANSGGYGAIALTRMQLLEKNYPLALNAALSGYAKNNGNSEHAENLALAYLFNDTEDNRINLKTLIRNNQMSATTMDEVQKQFEGKTPIVVE